VNKKLNVYLKLFNKIIVKLNQTLNVKKSKIQKKIITFRMLKFVRFGMEKTNYRLRILPQN
jgi:hypothetical protein